MRIHRSLLPLALATALLAPANASEETTDAYSDGDYGRLRYVSEGVSFARVEHGAEYDFPEAGEVNAPVFPGDALLTGADERAEVQLASGALVRVDERTEVTFLGLPSPYAERRDNTVLQVPEGTIRILATPDRDTDFRIDTPAASAWVVEAADVRIDVTPYRTRVTVRRGVVEVTGEGHTVVVRTGMETRIDLDRAPRDPRPFNTFAGDGFDRWVEDRDDYDASLYAEVYDELPDEVRPYYRELSSHGRWVRTSAYGWVWCPDGLSSDWRPYRTGRWAYGPRGYFWISAEPWGWAPYHYGRWNWIAGYGWSWCPGRVFGGAWVSWSWGPSYVGWAALDYWNRPLWRVGYRSGFYDPLCWSFVSYNHFRHPRSWQRYVAYDRVDVSRHAVVRRAPAVAPRDLVASADARRRAVKIAADDRGAQVERRADARAIGRGETFVERERIGRPVPTDRADRGSRSRSTTIERTREVSRTTEGRSASPRQDVYRRMSQPRQPRAATESRTPERTRTPTTTRTPERTRTPTTTRTPERTRTPTTTRTPERTRTPTTTRTPERTRTPTTTRTPERTRTPESTSERAPSKTPAKPAAKPRQPAKRSGSASRSSGSRSTPKARSGSSSSRSRGSSGKKTRSRGR